MAGTLVLACGFGILVLAGKTLEFAGGVFVLADGALALVCGTFAPACTLVGYVSPGYL